MIDFRQRLDQIRNGQARPLLADGAMGTMLFARGLKSGDCPELWNLERPADLTDIARLYFEAGAEIVQTNTFGASPLKLAEYGLESRAAEINAAAVKAVRAAVGDRAYISGSCGPSGRMLLPYGDTAPEVILESYKVQMAALREAGCDLICIETMTDIEEALLAVQAAHAVAPALPVVVTMTFDRTRRGFFTVMGTSIRAASERLMSVRCGEGGSNTPIAAIGANCGNGIETMVEVAKEFRAATSECESLPFPLMIQANAGLPEVVDGKLIYGESPEFYADKARGLIACGVAIIGGCCGTTPSHIDALRERLNF